MSSLFRLFSLSLLLALVSCAQSPKQPAQHDEPLTSAEPARDPHSYSNPAQVRVRHLSLDLEVSFEKRILQGNVVLDIERTAAGSASPLILDTHDLNITQAETAGASSEFVPAKFELGPKDRILGSPLTIQLLPRTFRVRVHYSSSPQARALQWLTPAQTAGKKYPFLYSQSQAIYARTWIPLQDSPGVRITYDARVRVPRHFIAVMSAEGNFQTGQARFPGNTMRSLPSSVPTEVGSVAQYSFQMTQAIPSYLIALAVGDLEFRPLGPRAGVYAEPAVIARAAAEFADTEIMIEVTEKFYGPYRWDRYDVLVLPPSFPYGGMENPRLTFATPTILAGDKSLIALVAHELAHSWSGNLVTNATWSDFWLNEGFTTYVQNRIVEAVYGTERAQMEAVLERQDLQEAIRTKPPQDQLLRLELQGRDPEEAVTDIPYIKGALFLRHLESSYGRLRFDTFLRGYFDHFAFQSISTRDFVDYLNQNLIQSATVSASLAVPVEEWIFKPGLPATAPQPKSEALAKVEAEAKSWLEGRLPTSKLQTSNWSFQQWLQFLRSLPADLSPERMRELDQVFHLTRSGNAEIVHQWLLMAIRSQYIPAYSRLEEFLITVGRRKFLRPLYTELTKTPDGRERALAIYKKARSGYHPIAVATIDEIVGWKVE
jgi:leukotriene A-4 hydrolase/aminopeptidase